MGNLRSCFHGMKRLFTKIYCQNIRQVYRRCNSSEWAEMGKGRGCVMDIGSAKEQIKNTIQIYLMKKPLAGDTSKAGFPVGCAGTWKNGDNAADCGRTGYWPGELFYDPSHAAERLGAAGYCRKGI